MSKYKEDITGTKKGMLTIIKQVGRDSNNRILWLCKCDCGNEKVITTSDLKKIVSCGCYNAERVKKPRKHGMCETRLYITYNNMIGRCTRPQNDHYKYYGARGIKICDEWLGKDGFIHFKDWALGNGYKDDLTIERINVNGNYEPQNCTWITNEEQANNRRTTHWITFNGETLNMTQWAKKLGISREAIKSRLSKGKTFEEIVGGLNNG